MKFNSEYLKTYENIIKTTDLLKGYQEFIKLFRYIKIKLEEALPLFSFCGNIVENGMDYSYFFFTDEELKNKGLKIVVVFVHKDFNFEVWLSGYNRKYQTEFYEKLKDQDLEYDLNHEPTKKDYILRAVVDRTIDYSDGQAVLEAIRKEIVLLHVYLKENLI